ncbi:MAG: Glyoxalase/bleomycin resistance protein/dioxygenase [Frankiales bacterium]|jgi:predicted enzyme related to lactoylglutathione lyase|nr:Glyoxalase/bleomycin resistance protein/dioxygenase [Frankiales bacterium]
MCWADLSSPDPAASAASGPLLGWTATAPQEEFGGYASFLLGEHQVAGLMPLMAPGQPPTWTVYVASDDADKTVARAEQAGGTVLAPPMDVAELGRMAVLVDPGGAVFGVWQAGSTSARRCSGRSVHRCGSS